MLKNIFYNSAIIFPYIFKEIRNGLAARNQGAIAMKIAAFDSVVWTIHKKSKFNCLKLFLHILITKFKLFFFVISFLH